MQQIPTQQHQLRAATIGEQQRTEINVAPITTAQAIQAPTASIGHHYVQTSAQTQPQTHALGPPQVGYQLGHQQLLQMPQQIVTAAPQQPAQIQYIVHPQQATAVLQPMTTTASIMPASQQNQATVPSSQQSAMQIHHQSHQQLQAMQSNTPIQYVQTAAIPHLQIVSTGLPIQQHVQYQAQQAPMQAQIQHTASHQTLMMPQGAQPATIQGPTLVSLNEGHHAAHYIHQPIHHDQQQHHLATHQYGHPLQAQAHPVPQHAQHQGSPQLAKFNFDDQKLKEQQHQPAKNNSNILFNNENAPLSVSQGQIGLNKVTSTSLNKSINSEDQKKNQTQILRNQTHQAFGHRAMGRPANGNNSEESSSQNSSSFTVSQMIQMSRPFENIYRRGSHPIEREQLQNMQLGGNLIPNQRRPHKLSQFANAHASSPDVIKDDTAIARNDQSAWPSDFKIREFKPKNVKKNNHGQNSSQNDSNNNSRSEYSSKKSEAYWQERQSYQDARDQQAAAQQQSFYQSTNQTSTFPQQQQQEVPEKAATQRQPQQAAPQRVQHGSGNMMSVRELYTTNHYKNLIENLYFESGDGEISIFRELVRHKKNRNQGNNHYEESYRIYMVTVIDIYTLYKEKRGKAIDLVNIVSRIQHPNLMRIHKWWYIADKCIFIESECPINAIQPGYFDKSFQTGYLESMEIDLNAQEQNRAWKTFCKRRFNLEDEMLFSLSKIAAGLHQLHKYGIIHRDVHPQRIQTFSFHKDLNIRDEYDLWKLQNSECAIKFNQIGLPFNFKKLLKRDNFSGHVNYSAPELIMDNASFCNKVDVWSFGCCIYYMINKKDPFDGRSPNETKSNIMNLQCEKSMTLQRFCQTKVHSQLLKYLITSCLEFHSDMRPTFEYIVRIIERHLYHSYQRPFINAQLNGQSQTFEEYQTLMYANKLNNVTDNMQQYQEERKQSDRLGMGEVSNGLPVAQDAKQSTGFHSNAKPFIPTKRNPSGEEPVPELRIDEKELVEEINQIAEDVNNEGRLNQSFIVNDNRPPLEQKSGDMDHSQEIKPRSRSSNIELGIQHLYIDKEGEVTIEQELSQMPQKLEDNVLDEIVINPDAIKDQGDKVIKIQKEQVITEEELKIIKDREYIDTDLLQAVNKSEEVQDLRLIKEADRKDMLDWVETAVEMLPEISTDVVEIVDNKIQNTAGSSGKKSAEKVAIIHKMNSFEMEQVKRVVDCSVNSLFPGTEQAVQDSGQKADSGHAENSLQPNVSKASSQEVLKELQTAEKRILEIIDENNNDEQSDGNSSEEVHQSLFSSNLFYSSRANKVPTSKKQGSVKSVQLDDLSNLRQNENNTIDMNMNSPAMVQGQMINEKEHEQHLPQNTSALPTLKNEVSHEYSIIAQREDSVVVNNKFHALPQTNKLTKLWFRDDGQIYEGEVDEHNERHGFGKLIAVGGDVFQGFWNNGMLIEEKLCQIVYGSGDIYLGFVKNELPEYFGQMQFTTTGERYEGEWTKGQVTGVGRFFFNCEDQLVYTGQLFQGDMYGLGDMISKSYRYYGQIKSGQFDGMGIHIDLKAEGGGTVYIGNFVEGKKDGLGIVQKLNDQIQLLDRMDFASIINSGEVIQHGQFCDNALVEAKDDLKTISVAFINQFNAIGMKLNEMMKRFYMQLERHTMFKQESQHLFETDRAGTSSKQSAVSAYAHLHNKLGDYVSANF